MNTYFKSKGAFMLDEESFFQDTFPDFYKWLSLFYPEFYKILNEEVDKVFGNNFTMNNDILEKYSKYFEEYEYEYEKFKKYYSG